MHAAHDAPDLSNLMSSLEHRLAHISEPPMLVASLAEWARERPAGELYLCLQHLLEGRPGADSTFDPLLEAMHRVLRLPPEAGGLPSRLRFEVYMLATDARDESVLALLRPSEPARSAEDDLRPPHEIAEIPLGRRRSLAKCFDRRLLEQLARDPDPEVIRNLVRNPRIREEDVLKLAAARPVAVTTLEVLEEEPRWSRARGVRAALARNPYAPIPLALQMQNGLSAVELREIQSDRTLHTVVRRHAQRLLAVRDAPASSAAAKISDAARPIE